MKFFSMICNCPPAYDYSEKLNLFKIWVIGESIQKVQHG
jgi:hypothetical protein